MLEFKINSRIKLRLEDGKTNIYVNNELFNQCKYVLVRKKVYELEDILETDSVDSLDIISKNLDNSLEEESLEIIHLSSFDNFSELKIQ